MIKNTRRRIVCSLTMILFLGFRAYAEIYLVSGTPTPQWNTTFAAGLFRVRDGRADLVETLANKSSGVEWIGVSYDMKRAVVLPRDPDQAIVVLDLITGQPIKRCTIPEIASATRQGQWLADLPNVGASFQWIGIGADIQNPILREFILDSAVPCGDSVTSMPASHIAHITAHGAVSVGDLNLWEGTYVNMDEAGNLTKRLPNAVVDLGFKIPLELRAGFKNPFVTLYVNNAEMLVVNLLQKSGATPIALVLNKKEQRWRRIPANLNPAGFRAFGKYVAVVEARTKESIADQQRKQTNVRVSADVVSERGTPGDAEWRKSNGVFGPNIAESFAEATQIFPGFLHLYDSQSERVYTINTRQGDSEIILVDDDTIYYRASDRLYAVKVDTSGLGPAQLVATGEPIRDAHWAFVTH